MGLYLRTKFQISSILLASFRQRVTPLPLTSKRTPKKPFQIRVKEKKRLLGKLSEKIGKPKELWKIIKKWVNQTDRLPRQEYASAWKKSWHFLPGQSQTPLKKHVVNLASEKNLKSFLSLQDDLEYLQCVSITRELTFVKKKLTFEKLCSVSILKILKVFKTNKATGVDNLTWRFLIDDANILFTPIARLCNISIKFTSFTDKWKVTKIKSLYKRSQN